MVKKRMAMRMLTIFVALIVCGMFFPDLARGATGEPSLSSDKGSTVEFNDLQLNEPSEIPVLITNESDETLKLLLQLERDDGCDFLYTGPSWKIFQPGESLSVSFTYTPSNYDECGAILRISDMEDVDPITGQMATLATIALIGDLEEMAEDPKTFEPILMDGFPTGVMDRLVEIDGNNTSTLQEMIDECVAKSEERGQIMRLVAWMTGELRREGVISDLEKRQLRRSAARLEMQQIIQTMKTRKNKRNGHRGSRRFWWLCRNR